MFQYVVTKITSHEYGQNPNLIIHGKIITKYGPCLLAITDGEKLCFVYFCKDYNLGFKELKNIYPLSNYTLNDQIIGRFVHYFEMNATGIIHLQLKGTNFQMKVWEYLLSIQRGSTVSYEEVAKGIGNPRGSRAVANAISKNNIAYFVPCHRVISKNRNLNKYRWGVEIKKLMLCEEMMNSFKN
ncbi:bifunctional transcriptional activator/DNA repair enzyme Ada [Diorhabda carinulata]|uniref:bifunctional transcriptional activator/DNA repair enzyme Ada n=1 Tax=Diorhabda carinulata TaxID=1163345 RepID=UPI0025A2C804|nr:bifunctional transcriptional activator/DNA repair enzyme Ada [Diorhabda carinulata]